jgi:small subunit ribosomal protein S15e
LRLGGARFNLDWRWETDPVVFVWYRQAAARKRTFKKFSFRGIDLENLLDLSNEQLMDLVHARARRRFSNRGLKRKPVALLKKLRKAVR